MIQRKRYYLFLLPLLLFFMLLSGGKGPLISLLITMSIYFLMDFNKKTILSVIAILVFVILFINSDFYTNTLLNKYSGLYRIDYAISEYFKSGMQIESVSVGRKYYYSKAIKEFYNWPLFGIGIGTDETFGGYAHNSFLEIASQLGIIALFINNKHLVYPILQVRKKRIF